MTLPELVSITPETSQKFCYLILWETIVSRPDQTADSIQYKGVACQGESEALNPKVRAMPRPVLPGTLN
ncbi:MAG: hypothetical protein ACE5JA_09870, partial [bacterium]